MKNSSPDFGRFARDVAASSTDRRSRAALGLQEADATLGGFAVPERYADEIMTTIYADAASPISALRQFSVDGPGNVLHVPGVDETSRGDGYRFGGIVADFQLEGIQPPFAAPKFKNTDFGLEKMTALVRMSSELWSDVPSLGDFLLNAIADEMRRKLEAYIFSAAGVGAQIPLSILNSSALIQVVAQGGQTAGTIVEQNIIDMWAALPSASRRRAIWLASESASAQLLLAGYSTLYAPSGAANAHDGPRVYGRPLYELDSLPIVGTPGDLMLIDPQWYGVAVKTPRQAFSADCLFASDEALFRVNMRAMGRPLVSVPLAATDGTQRSAFVALAQR